MLLHGRRLRCCGRDHESLRMPDRLVMFDSAVVAARDAATLCKPKYLNFKTDVKEKLSP